uniref:C2H2-type domain-containing protein n=1 Tax=Nothobranchius furzeri TaxID=105023 RepID=A0A8C6KHM1_NOTFU
MNCFYFLFETELNVEKPASSDSDPEEVFSTLKEEVTMQDGASIKHEVGYFPFPSCDEGSQNDICSTESSCFRPGFKSDETSNEAEENAFQFLDRERENRHSNQNTDHSRDVEQKGTQSDHLHVPSGETAWQTGDVRAVRNPSNHTRRITNFGSRNPLRPQSNSSSLAARPLSSLIHHPAPGGGNGRPYSCPYCTKCFTYPSHQRRHLLRHTGVRPHPCQFCDKSFLTPSELTVHTRTHTGERPFGCAQCGKRFARSGNMRAHQRDVHMGKRPFACTEFQGSAIRGSGAACGSSIHLMRLSVLVK